MNGASNDGVSLKYKQHIKTSYFLLKLSCFYHHGESANRIQGKSGTGVCLDWRMEACILIKIHSSTVIFLLSLSDFFRTNTYAAGHCEWLLMMLEILKDLLIYFNKRQFKTSIQQEMFGEKMFCGKCSCEVIRASDENSWKTSFS